MASLTESVGTNQQTPVYNFFKLNTSYIATVRLSGTLNIPHSLPMAYVRPQILFSDNIQEYVSH